MNPQVKIVAAEFLNESEAVIALSNGEDILISVDKLLALDLPRLVFDPLGDCCQKVPGAGLERPAGEN